MTADVLAMLDAGTPEVPVETAAGVLRERWGIEAPLRNLGSHQDQNLLVLRPEGRLILKLGNAAVPRETLEAQHAALEAIRAAAIGVDVPQPLPARDGTLIGELEHEGAVLPVRLVTFIEGQQLADWRYLAPGVVRAWGRLAGATSRALAGLDHPGARRVLQWDIAHTRTLVDALLPTLPADDVRDRVGDLVARSWARLERHEPALPRQASHTDITDFNVIARRDRAGRPQLVGLIDPGDILETWRASEVAGVVESALWHATDEPLALAVALVAAFHEACPLTPDELDALPALIALRAAQCYVSSGHQAETEPGNDYVAGAADNDRDALVATLGIDQALAAAAFRAACGLPRASRPGLSARLAGAVPVVADLPAAAPVLDLGVESELLDEGAFLAPATLRARIEALAAAAGAAVGRYGEARLHHTAVRRADEPATWHLGTDVLVPAGTAVRAPLAGRVVTVSASELLLDHGDGLHSRLAGIEPDVAAGDAVAAGAPLGTVALAPDDAALPAHVHVQLAVGGPDDVPATLPGLVRASLAGAWAQLCPDPSALVGRPAAAPACDPQALLALRRSHVADAQELYFEAPPTIPRGWREHLFDEHGRAYLDGVNNVAVVGHSHPRVHAAASRQLRLLNTNSRFLYPSLAAFAKRLADLLPDPLTHVFLVASGSEANDLALRLARTATGQADMIAVESAYHGWTTATFEISTSLFDNPNYRETLPPTVHPVASPNLYRGRYREDDPDACARYVAHVDEALAAIAAAGRAPAAFICEPFYGNAGGVPLPDGYLAAVYPRVRAAGGLCIADEVQVGYGRLGSWFWAFEQQGVVPDIVTLAKSTGNGHPVAAVVTTAAIAERFGRDASFFASTGGSPLSCAVALAVLDAMDEEGTTERARVVGAHLKARLERICERFPIAGAAHGAGLYLGLDLVRDRETREPATEEAYAICERLRELGAIVQPTGDHTNVLKLKPPLVFELADADFLADQIERTLTDGW